MSFVWPTALPAPTFTGSSVVYRDVYPGADLVVDASVRGVRPKLVFRTEAAAADSKRARLDFRLKAQGVRVRAGAEGSLVGVDGNGVPVLGGVPGALWASPSGAGASLASADGADAAADADPTTEEVRVGDVLASATESSWTVIPQGASSQGAALSSQSSADVATSTSSGTFVDALFGFYQTSNLMLSSDSGHSPKWNFTGDEGMGRCSSKVINGVSYYCGSGYVKRLFFQYSRSKLAGKVILDATFKAKETFSFSCTATPVTLSRMDAEITSSTQWPGPNPVDKLVKETVSAGRGTACSPDQPDEWVEFHDDPSDSTENLLSTVRQFQDGAWSKLTLGLRAHDETEPDQWKQFNDDAMLSLRYVYEPGSPTDIGVQASSASTLSCSPQSTYTATGGPTSVTTTKPTFGATAQTLLQPAAGEETGSLGLQFRVTPMYTSAVPSYTSPVMTSGWFPDDTPNKATLGTAAWPGALAEGVTYKLQVRTQSHYSRGDLFAPANWDFSSPVCFFRVSPYAPTAPTVAALPNADVTYQECAGSDCTANGAPGMSGDFKFSKDPNSTVSVTRYVWVLTADGDPANPATGSASAVAGVATVTVTPQVEGNHKLTVTPYNLTQAGVPTTYAFKVDKGTGPVGAWSATSPAAAGVDTAAAGRNLTLAGDATGVPNGRRLSTTSGLDGAISLPGTAGSGAATTTPVLDTSKSFTVATWAYRRAAGTSVVLSQHGANATDPGFVLSYSEPDKKWVFGWGYRTSTGSLNYTYSMAKAATAPPLGVWTHLAGVYNASTRSVQLFVNGVPQGTTVLPAAAVASAGRFAVGRGEQGSGWGFFTGLIDEVRAWNRPLTTSEMRTEALLLDPVSGHQEAALVAFYEPRNEMDALRLTDQSLFGHSPLDPAGGASAADGTGLKLDGIDDVAHTPGPMVDQTTSFTVGVKLSAMTESTGTRRVVAQRNGWDSKSSSWSLGYDYAAGRWLFEVSGFDAAGNPRTASASRLGSIPLGDQDRVVYGRWDASTGTATITVAGLDGDTNPALIESGQGANEFSLGAAYAAGAWAERQATTVQWVRVWAGKIDANELPQELQ